MRPWVKFCFSHRMKFVVLAVWGISLPLYFRLFFSDYFSQAIRAWKEEGNALLDEANNEGGVHNE